MSALDSQLVRSVAWSGLLKWLGQLISWVSTIVVARTLVPADYGLIAMSTSFMGLLALMNEFGLGATVVSKRDLDANQIAQLNTFSVLLSLVAFAIMCVAAFPLATFYSAPELPIVMFVMGFGFLITAFRTVPSALLAKDLRFKKVAVIESLQVLISVCVTMTIAWWKPSYWALVLGPLAGNLFATAMIASARPTGLKWPRRSALGDALLMSWHVVGANVSWYVASTSDLFVTGRVLGSSAMGAYQMGMTLASMPIEKILGTINRVMPAFYSAVQTDSAAMRRYLLGATEMAALVVFPVSIGFALVAEEAVLLLLGEKWREAILPLMILSYYTALRSLITIVASTLFPLGESRIGFWNGILSLFLFPLAFYIGSGWGLLGISLAWLVAHPLISIPIYIRVFKRIELPFSQFLRTIWPAASSCIVMAIAVVAVKHYAHSLPLLALLLVEIAAGAVGYGLAILVLHRPVVRRVRQLLTLARGK